MPTRAATAAAAAANTRTTRSRKAQQPAGKENAATPLLSSSTKGKDKSASKKSARNVKAAKKVDELFCSCRGIDDGTPMVQCGTCDEWYHFQCIQLSEDDASEIMVYVCPSCQEKTGRRTVMEWEGPDALEPIEDVPPEEPTGTTQTPATRADKPEQAEDEIERSETKPQQRRQRSSPAELSESSDDGSGDEYIDDADRPEGATGTAHKRKRANNRRIAVPSSSDSDEDVENEKATATGAHPRQSNVTSTKSKTISTSPQPGSLKRRQSTSSLGCPDSTFHRKAQACRDAARKYCLGKFTEMFTGIFMQYPHIQQETNAGESGDHNKAMVERKPEELTEADKTQVCERATAFATQVEQAVFDTYSEPDRLGNPGTGVKYKERFRTLTFNLQQSDRVALHKRISSGQVAPATLSTMSSTDLASLEQQQSIKQAEQEALEHSILIKKAVPRSKITHKGLQDIEDVNEDSAIAKQREREIEMAEQERERERLARLRTVPALAHSHSNPPSASVPPESPVVPSSASGVPPVSWGAPPPVPPIQASDFTHAVDPELNLGDFIHMDDEPPESAPRSADSSHPGSDLPTSVGESSAARTGTTQQGPSTPITGISPFAQSKPDMPPRASFDLNALWSAPPPPPPPNEAGHPSSGESTEANDSGEAMMDLDTPTPPTEEVGSRGGESGTAAAGSEQGVEHEGEGGKNLDFAMFLGQEEEEKDKERERDREKEMIGLASQPDPQVVFEGLPHVWSGTISMPVDSSAPQELTVIARQIGGRGLAADSPLWRTLFPLGHLRIDGRVAVGSSTEYLLASRLNSAKELIAVAWTPVSGADMAALKALSTFLIKKDRHGLIFPWGSRGREWGRELYVIPLLSSHTLPDYLELLDDLRLPKTRSADCLVGIWVLNRGRLVAPPPPAPLQPAALVLPPTQTSHAGQSLPFAPPPGQRVSALPPALASALASIMPAGAVLPNAGPAALAAALSHLPTAPPLVTQATPTPVSAAIAPASTAELAAQVASLTPEQIQSMLATLHQQQQLPQAGSSAPLPVPSMPVPGPPPQPQQASQSPAVAAALQMPGAAAPWASPQAQQLPQAPTMTMQKPYDGYNERERGGGARRGGYHGRDESPRGRGRGGGRRGGVGIGSGGRDDGYRRMSDAGWGGRGGRGTSSGSPGRREGPSYWR
ncbi:hypothetical protein F5148DRAFT_1298712 [Russula earlei]|uniref:Uncharacterized protein n=1 Tax=Russula earlei TaxID=71964 RepID=A0ACC0UDW2_9AGAM|nr:hypothetical protein F5148DRAFT_1298712 [Russula earlei]